MTMLQIPATSFTVAKRQKVAVCVCTYRRPLMLTACLASLMAQMHPAGVDVEIVVVDNADGMTILQSNGEFHLVHEPRRGISFARNAALEKALALGAAWIAFLDDDETAAPDWLVRLFEAQACFDVDIVHGHVDFEYPDPLPTWAFPKKRKPYWKFNAEVAFTNNVLFRAEIARKGLRFGEEFALSGGEDHAFFQRARKSGALIIHTPRAVVVETLPESKLTFRKQVGRAFWVENTNVRIDVAVKGKLRTIPRKAWKAVSRVFGGFWQTLRIPFSSLHGRGRHRALRAATRFAEAAGIMLAFAGYRPEPYRTVDGG